MALSADIIAEAHRETKRTLSTPVPASVAAELGCAPGCTETDVLACVGVQPDALLAHIAQREPQLLRLFCLLKMAAFANAAKSLGLSVDFVNPTSNRTRLGMAAAGGDLPCAYFLLKHGANPTWKAPCGLTPHDELVAACNKMCGTYSLGCHHEAVKALLIEAAAQ